jgi:hypothetical protein
MMCCHCADTHNCSAFSTMRCGQLHSPSSLCHPPVHRRQPHRLRWVASSPIARCSSPQRRRARSTRRVRPACRCRRSRRWLRGRCRTARCAPISRSYRRVCGDSVCGVLRVMPLLVAEMTSTIPLSQQRFIAMRQLRSCDVSCEPTRLTRSV